MARTNKYTAINFNHIYEKSLTNSPSNNQSKQSPASANGLHSLISSRNPYKSHLSSSRSQSRMLVLTRPAPKPASSTATPPISPPPQTPPTQKSEFQIPENPRSEPGSDPISLRPLGRTGAGGAPVVLAPEVVLPKPEKFVPPHLRPGFAGKEAKPEPAVFRGKEQNHRQSSQSHQQGGFGSSVKYGDDGRPKSGGHDRRGRGGDPDPGFVNRPRSSGYRPNSSG